MKIRIYLKDDPNFTKTLKCDLFWFEKNRFAIPMHLPLDRVSMIRVYSANIKTDICVKQIKMVSNGHSFFDGFFYEYEVESKVLLTISKKPEDRDRPSLFKGKKRCNVVDHELDDEAIENLSRTFEEASKAITANAIVLGVEDVEGGES
jgi:hypothetical protein